MSDQLIRAISKDGFIKASAVSTRGLTERARQIWGEYWRRRL